MKLSFRIIFLFLFKPWIFWFDLWSSSLGSKQIVKSIGRKYNYDIIHGNFINIFLMIKWHQLSTGSLQWQSSIIQPLWSVYKNWITQFSQWYEKSVQWYNCIIQHMQSVKCIQFNNDIWSHNCLNSVKGVQW